MANRKGQGTVARKRKMDTARRSVTLVAKAGQEVVLPKSRETDQFEVFECGPQTDQFVPFGKVYVPKQCKGAVSFTLPKDRETENFVVYHQGSSKTEFVPFGRVYVPRTKGRAPQSVTVQAAA